MRLLVVHQNFPGQFAHMVREWAARPGWDVRGLGRDTAPGLPGFEGLIRYRLHRKVHANQHPYLRQMESATLHGQGAARAMLKLRDAGFTPDTILAHPGWGESLYAKDVFPAARLVHLCEWFYAADGADLGFDPQFPVTFDDRARVRTWNALHILNLEHCDAAISPTAWQKSRHPKIFQSKITVQHEGIALEELRPDRDASILLADGTTLRAGDPVVTYVARNLEPYRGFHVFMRMLERVQAANGNCQAVIVGGDDVSYGKPPHDGLGWRQTMLRECRIDPSRTHFLGRVPRAYFIRLLQVSAAHVYLTYPFVLSWSLLEAMACATPIVASDTAPVREVLTDRSMARLCDFFDLDALCAAVLGLLRNRDEGRRLGARAREHVQSFDRRLAVASYEKTLSGHSRLASPTQLQESP